MRPEQSGWTQREKHTLDFRDFCIKKKKRRHAKDPNNCVTCLNSCVFFNISAKIKHSYLFLFILKYGY